MSTSVPSGHEGDAREDDRFERRPAQWVQITIAVASILIVVLPTINVLIVNDGDPTALLRVGSDAISRPTIEEDFDDPVLVKGWGHDGQQYYVIARSLPDVEAADGKVDRLLYRVRRVLLPAMVSPLPDGAPLVWGMLAVNCAAVGMAGIALARIAARLGVSPWVGITVGLSPALLVTVEASLADPLALALALWGVVVWRRHLGWAAVIFTLAALARETLLVVPLACLLAASTRRQRLVLLTPFVSYAVWILLTGLFIHPSDTGSAAPLGDALRHFDVPFRAIVLDGLTGDSAVIGLGLFACSLLAARILWDRQRELGWWLLIDGVLLVCASTAVVSDTMSLTRLTALGLPGLVLAVGCLAADDRSRRASTGTGRADLVG